MGYMGTFGGGGIDSVKNPGPKDPAFFAPSKGAVKYILTIPLREYYKFPLSRGLLSIFWRFHCVNITSSPFQGGQGDVFWIWETSRLLTPLSCETCSSELPPSRGDFYSMAEPSGLHRAHRTRFLILNEHPCHKQQGIFLSFLDPGSSPAWRAVKDRFFHFCNTLAAGHPVIKPRL